MRAEPVIQVIGRMAATSAHLMEEASVWNAVLTLAKALPVVGRMAGSDALSCIGSVIPRRELASLFADGLSHIHETEIAMRQAAVALSARSIQPADERDKGQDSCSRIEAIRPQTIPALTIACQLEITAETLWRAFGDGALRLRRLGDVGSADVLTP
jgi:hypothetical protein